MSRGEGPRRAPTSRGEGRGAGPRRVPNLPVSMRRERMLLRRNFRLVGLRVSIISSGVTEYGQHEPLRSNQLTQLHYISSPLQYRLKRTRRQTKTNRCN